MGWKGDRIRQERGFYNSWITLVATVKNLFTFVLLNGGVPDVDTIYSVSVEHKKKNCLQKLPVVSDNKRWSDLLNK